MSRSAQTVWAGAILSVQVVVRMLSPILLAPLIVKSSGGEALGAFAVISQVTGYLLLLELGVGEALSRQLTHRVGDEAATQDLVTTGAVYLFVVGFTVGLLCFGLAAITPLWLNASPPISNEAATSVLVLGLWAPLRFPLQIFSFFLISRERVREYAVIQVVSDVLRIAASVLFIVADLPILGFVVSMIAAESLTALLSFQATRLNLRRSGAGFQVPLLRDLLGVGLPLSVMSAGDRMTLFSQNFLVGAIFNADAAASFYATRTPGFAAGSFLWRAQDAVVPGINVIYSQNELERVRSAFVRTVGYSLAVALCVGSAVVVFNDRLIQAWLGSTLALGIWAAAAVGVLVVLVTLRSIATKFLVMAAAHRKFMWVVLCEGVLTIGLSVWWGRKFGLLGVLWAPVASQMLSLPILMFQIAKVLQVRVSEISAAVFRRALTGGAAGIGAAIFVSGLSTRLPWLLAAAAVGIIGAVGFVVFGLLPDDRLAFLRSIRLRRT